jgi:hypothetical protein
MLFLAASGKKRHGEASLSAPFQQICFLLFCAASAETSVVKL